MGKHTKGDREGKDRGRKPVESIKFKRREGGEFLKGMISCVGSSEDLKDLLGFATRV